MSAVGDVADPPVALTGEVPCLQRVVALDHHVVAHSFHPRVRRDNQIRTSDRWTGTKQSSLLRFGRRTSFRFAPIKFAYLSYSR